MSPAPRVKINSENREVFESMAPGRAILKLTVPTIIAQIATVLYAVVDLFYVGQLGDPAQVAAVRLAFPPFLFLAALANLFGIGASSAIGRSLGAENCEKASACSGFAFWGAILIAVVYPLLVKCNEHAVLGFLGTRPDTYAPTAVYMVWTVYFGGIPLVMSQVLSNLLRAEGYAKTAGKGILLGGFTNVLVAPLLIFVLDMQVEGASLAIFISNVVSSLYQMNFIRKRRGGTVISLTPASALRGLRYAREIILVGFPSSVMTTMASLSNLALNMLAAAYGSESVAALGIAKMVDQLIFTCSIGLAQGSLPLIAYNYASGNHDRLRAIVRTAITGGVAGSVAATAALMICAGGITSVFIREPVTAGYAADFIRIIALACPLSVIGQFTVSGFQACGAKWRPLLIAFMRKGAIDVPLMFAFSGVFGLYGLAWAVPVSEVISSAGGFFLYIPFIKKLKGKK